MLKDYYAILNVLPRASGEEIRRAFKRLALQFHPDKIGGGAATEATSALHTDNHRLTKSTAEYPSTTVSVDRLDASTAPCQPRTRDFTDIQEAYEVLGDVARRYLYDMNYHELLAFQQQRQQEEQQRFDAQARVVAEAARRLRERECLGRQQQPQNCQPQNTTLSTVDTSTTSAGLRSSPLGCSLTQHTQLPTGGREKGDTAVPSLPLPPNDALQNKQRRRRLVSVEEKGGNCLIEDLDGDVGGDGQPLTDRYCFAVPTRSREDGSRADVAQTRRQGDPCDTNESAATGQTQRRISCASTKGARPRIAATVPTVFVLSGSVAFSWSDAAAQTCPSVAERGRSRGRRWHRHATIRDGKETPETELPLEYYYQRSIERTLRVFFDRPHLE